MWNFEWFSSPHGPLLLQNQFFIQFHNISHPGVWALRMIIYTIVWPRMSRDIGLWARSCLSYQRSKITHFYSPVPSTPSCSNPEIFSCSRWYCWTLTFQSRIYIPSHHDGQDYKMAWGCSLVLHLLIVMCLCFHLNMNLQVRSSSCSHIQGSQFSICSNPGSTLQRILSWLWKHRIRRSKTILEIMSQKVVILSLFF